MWHLLHKIDRRSRSHTVYIYRGLIVCMSTYIYSIFPRITICTRITVWSLQSCGQTHKITCVLVPWRSRYAKWVTWTNLLPKWSRKANFSRGPSISWLSFFTSGTRIAFDTFPPLQQDFESIVNDQSSDDRNNRTLLQTFMRVCGRDLASTG